MATMEWSRAENVWIKTCITCKLVFKVAATTFAEAQIAFSPKFGSHGTTYDNLHSWCKSCQNAYTGNRASGIQRDEVLAGQSGKCFLCPKEISFAERTAVTDHCHKSSLARHVLCSNCNQRMAAVDDDEWLAKAIAYRDSFRCE